MRIECTECGSINTVPSEAENKRFRCFNCDSLLPQHPKDEGETSAAVGLIGGAALGAAVGGPFGAVVGAIIGAILGKEAKGLG